MGSDNCLKRYHPITREELRQMILTSMEDDWIVDQYSNLDDEYPNEYDNPIVKQIMEME